MKGVTALNKQMARHYCELLNKIYWKIPVPKDFKDQRAWAEYLAAEASELVSMRQISSGKKYDIVWDEANDLFKPDALTTKD